MRKAAARKTQRRWKSGRKKSHRKKKEGGNLAVFPHSLSLALRPPAHFLSLAREGEKSSTGRFIPIIVAKSEKKKARRESSTRSTEAYEWSGEAPDLRDQTKEKGRKILRSSTDWHAAFVLRIEFF